MANSSRSEQSAQSRGSCNEDLGSRSCGQMLVEASSPENLATDERTNWQMCQIRSLSHQLIHNTKLIKPRVGYEILTSGMSSEHDFILSSRNDDQNREEELHCFVDLQYLLVRTMHTFWYTAVREGVFTGFG